MLDRKAITAGLHMSVRKYWADKMYSVHHEVGILPRGRRKVDVFAFNMKRHIVISEVKSCAADFNGDDKFHLYLPYCHKLYLVITQDYWESKAARRLEARAREVGAGVMVQSRLTGKLRVMVNAQKRDVLPKGFKLQILTKLAWRTGWLATRSALKAARK